MPVLSDDIGINALLDLTGADREAKAYAFLYAAFKRTEIGSNPVRDAIDCLIPFMAPYLADIPGNVIKVDAVCDYMKSKFGFDFPMYAMQQLIADLPKHGLADYNKVAKAHIARPGVKSDFKVAKSDIETNFDNIVKRISEYAVSLHFYQDPSSGTWGDALINFLKGSVEPQKKATAKVKTQILGSHKPEVAIIGAFISKLHASEPANFEKVLHIFMGVLVEEFISSVSEVGADGDIDVVILYDTAVLLRLLGTSGSLLKHATEELTRYLQDLGCKIFYFSGNESEIQNIFSTIVHIKDTGGELEGETADAISRGEVTITDIRMLQNSFPERLAALNVFPADGLLASQQVNTRHQINESGFSAYLLQQANATGRRYSVDNRAHDAQYLGHIMRMRAGSKTRDFANCQYLFVTSNRFLAYSSRKFLIQDGMLSQQHFPPMMSLGQIATIAWLMKDRKLAPEKAGRELLSNCFAAIRPDAEWFKYFREGIERAGGSVELYGRDNIGSLTLQAARRIAQEESLGSAALVRELNMAEILSRAEAEREADVKRRQADLEAIQSAAAAEREALLERAAAQIESVSAQQQAILEEERRKHALAIESERKRLNIEVEERIRKSSIESSERWARRIIGFVKISLLLVFFTFTLWSIILRMNGHSNYTLYILSMILGAIQVVTFANFLKIPIVANWIPSFEVWLSKEIRKWRTLA